MIYRYQLVSVAIGLYVGHRRLARLLAILASLATMALLLSVWFTSSHINYHYVFARNPVKQNMVVSAPTAESCSEVTHVAFIKVHKCASDTVTGILQRFGDERNLSFVLPRGDWNLNWPVGPPSAYDYLPATNPFNILCYHTIYSRETMHRLMPPATKYVAILREPYAQFWSTMNYFHGFQESSPLHGQRIRKQGKVFLGDPDFYYEYLDYSARHSIQMSHDLGLPARHRRNETEIAEFLRRTDEDFDLVLIREYFDESLVLLRRLLCWPLRSIVYQTRNAKTYETSVTPTTSSQEHENEDRNLRAAYRAWNAADARLYDHFNATLWKRIAREENFHEEVSFFRRTNRKVSIACAGLGRLKKKSLAVRVRKSKWSPAFSIDGGFCHRLELDVISYLKRLKLSYYERSNSSKNA